MLSACTLVLPGSPFGVLPKWKNYRASLIKVLSKKKSKKKEVSEGSPSTQIEAANMGERQSSGAGDKSRCLSWARSSLCGWHLWEMAFISAPFLC